MHNSIKYNRGYLHFLIPVLLLLNINTSIAQQFLFKFLKPQDTGIYFKNEIKETEDLNVLSYEYFYNGGGVSAGDINNDGLIDLYFTANMQPDKLYLNLGGLKFKDITKSSKIISASKWKTGVTMADVNADGLLDLYICHSGSGNTQSRKNQLYINNGNLTFTEKAKEFGLDDSSYSTQAAFFDYDHDGDLDMYLVNHNIKDYKDVELPSLKQSYDSLAGDKLYKNTSGHFQDVSRASGITGNPISFGLGISVADVNNDGWSDIYVSNDYRENDYLYINNHDGTFTNKINESFNHISEFSMGNDIADINNDGLPDIITLDMLPEDNRRQKLLQGQENYELHASLVKNGFHNQYMRNMLQINNGDGTFSEVGQLAGVSNTDWSWSALFADFDNDGNKDLFISNGYLRDYTNKDFLKFWGNYIVQKAMEKERVQLMDLVKNMPSTLTRNYIFKNNTEVIFTNESENWGLTQLAVSSGAAYADLDNDGDLELVINNVNEFAFIYENKANECLQNHSVDFQLIGNGNNTFGLGAHIKIFCKNKLQVLEQAPTRGYQSSVSQILHAGLGEAVKIDSLVVVWPDGKEQKVFDVKPNQRIVFKESDALPNSRSDVRLAPLYFEKNKTTLPFTHKDPVINDFKRQPLMPSMLSHSGPVLIKGDINKDGLIDIFIGASAGQPGKLLIKKNDGSFEESSTYIFNEDKNYAATDAEFFDADGDDDLDLYVVSGMYSDYLPGSPMLNDRLYINDGEGLMIKRKFIQTNASGKSCITVADFDHDGDKDLFLGGRVIPGKYPTPPASYLMKNDGKGNFTDVTLEACAALKEIGMVTDATWTDVNKDGYADLIIVGEFMPITLFTSNGETLVNKTLDYFTKDYSGLWNTLIVSDIDDDGDNDLVAGNIGSNTQLKSSDNEPLEMIYKDFDGNSSVDPLLCFYIQGKSYPYISRDELLDQIYPMRKKFTSYKSYADATINDMFSTEELSGSKKLTANFLKTVIFENREGRYFEKELPIQAQYSSINAIQVIDVNKDDKKDILLFGNNNYTRLKLGNQDANYGVLLLNDGVDNYKYIPQTQSGLSVMGDVKSTLVLDSLKNKELILGINGSAIITYKFSPANE